MIIGIAYFSCWHARMGLLYILGSTWWIAILYGGSAYSPVSFFGNLWRHPEQTLLLSCNNTSVKRLKGAGKTGDVCCHNRCAGRTTIWLGVFPGDCSAKRIEIWLGIIPHDYVVIWLGITRADKVKWILAGIESWFCTVMTVPEYVRRAGLSFHEDSSDCV